MGGHGIALEARTLLRSLVRQLGARTRAITVLDAARGEERYGEITRTAGYQYLKVTMAAR